MGGLSIVIVILIFIFAIMLIVDFFRFKRKLESNIKYGIFFGVILFFLSIFTIMGDITGLLFVSIIVGFLRTIVYVSAGNYYCSVLKIKDIPLIRRLFNHCGDCNEDQSIKEVPSEHDEEEAVTETCTYEGVCADEITECEEVINESYVEIEWKKYFVWTLSMLIGCIAYSIILFKLTSPEASDIIKDIMQRSGGMKEADTQTVAAVVIMVFTIAINEEILFRLAIQNLFAAKFNVRNEKYWIAIVLTSLFWTLGHTNALNPEWVKFAQIFPIGIVLGFTFKRFGLESCMIIHGLFNVIMTILQLQGWVNV